MSASAPEVSVAAAAPRHVAIIMDGNGRWARERGRPRTFGHSAGVEALRRTVEAAGEIGLPWLTVYGFSTENWSRPPEEVDALFDLLRLYVRRDLDKLIRDGVRVRVIGDRQNLSADIVRIIEDAEMRSAGNDRLNLTIAFNYGGQAEIAHAARVLAREAAAGRLDPETIDVAMIERHLYNPDIPPPDLLVRTSGERRISNFLLWGSAYAELVFQDVLWPDFNRAWLEAAIADYGRRDRRFGGA